MKRIFGKELSDTDWQRIAWLVAVVLIVVGTIIGVQFPQLPPFPGADTVERLGYTHFSGLHVAVPTAQASATPGVIFNSLAADGDTLVIEKAGTPVYQIDADGNVTSGGGETQTGGQTFNNWVAVVATPAASATPQFLVSDVGAGQAIEMRNASATPIVQMDASAGVVNAGALDQQGSISDSGGDVTIADNLDITGTLDVQGGDVTLANDETVGNSTDGTIDFGIAGTSEYSMTASLLDLGGNCLDLDDAGTTSICADTDNQVDIEVNGVDDFRITANTFTALSGSTIAADTLDDTSGSGMTINGNVALTGTLDVQGGDVTLANDETVGNSTDGTIDFGIAGTSEYSMTASLLDLGGNCLDLDADGDTSLCSDTDDQIDFELSGVDDFRVTANTFTALSGSTIAADTLDDTSGSGMTINANLDVTGTLQLGASNRYPMEFASSARVMYVGAATTVTQTTVTSATHGASTAVSMVLCNVNDPDEDAGDPFLCTASITDCDVTLQAVQDDGEDATNTGDLYYLIVGY